MLLREILRKRYQAQYAASSMIAERYHAFLLASDKPISDKPYTFLTQDYIGVQQANIYIGLDDNHCKVGSSERGGFFIIYDSHASFAQHMAEQYCLNYDFPIGKKPDHKWRSLIKMEEEAVPFNRGRIIHLKSGKVLRFNQLSTYKRNTMLKLIKLEEGDYHD